MSPKIMNLFAIFEDIQIQLTYTFHLTFTYLLTMEITTSKMVIRNQVLLKKTNYVHIFYVVTVVTHSDNNSFFLYNGTLTFD